MKRLITKKLIAWKTQPNRKPLIVRGARQVGKSYIINEFGNGHFKGAVHIINFEKQPDWQRIFDLNLDINRIVSELEIILNKRITEGEDLLFLDEIQECPKAILALRYFFEQKPEMHVIAAGSLLEFALKDISFPVGRVQLINMHPMNFYEYLCAVGKDLLAETILQSPIKLSDSIHNLLKMEIRNYFMVGGMPECVKVYAQNKRFPDVFDIQSDLINSFRQDFSKYAQFSDKRCLNAVLLSVSQNIGHQVKYSRLAEDFTNPTIKKAFELMETARIFKKVISSSPEGIPLGANTADKTFKTIMLDIGLLSRFSGFSTSVEFQKTDLLSIFRGSLAEQFVGQELISAGHSELYYWSRHAKSSSAETDYLIEKNNEIIPIEVKSGAAGSLKSLHLLLNTYPNIKKGFIFSDASYGEIIEQKLVFIPMYFVFSSCGI